MAETGRTVSGSGESASNEAGDKIAAVLAARRGGERAVLPFEEAPGVDHHGHEELTLPLREAELPKACDPAHVDAIEPRIVRVFVRHRNSSMTRGCGPERPPPPREATT